MTLRIASAEIVSILFMLVIMGSSLRNDNKKSLNRTSFLALIITTMIGLGFDALSYILDDAVCSNNTVLTVTNIMAFSMINLCIVSFSFYMISFISRAADHSRGFLYTALAICAVNIILILTGSFNGDFFTVTDHHMRYGRWSELITIMPVFSVIILLIVLLKNTKNLGKRNSVVLGSFVIFPIIAAIIVVFFPDIQLAYLAAALSCSIIFTFVRREEINEVQLREEIMNQISSHDTLTGLMNRRGFDDAIGRADEHEKLGIVFCDLNSLKYINDNFGHTAGDDYIRKFADILRQIFEDLGPVCRISGDEFIVLLYDISEAVLEELKAKMDETVRKNDRIASTGYAYGESSSALTLIKQAEQEMYEEKNRYYAETGMDRRRRI